MFKVIEKNDAYIIKRAKNILSDKYFYILYLYDLEKYKGVKRGLLEKNITIKSITKDKSNNQIIFRYNTNRSIYNKIKYYIIEERGIREIGIEWQINYFLIWSIC